MRARAFGLVMAAIVTMTQPTMAHATPDGQCNPLQVPECQTGGPIIIPGPTTGDPVPAMAPCKLADVGLDGGEVPHGTSVLSGGHYHQCYNGNWISP